MMRKVKHGIMQGYIMLGRRNLGGCLIADTYCTSEIIHIHIAESSTNV